MKMLKEFVTILMALSTGLMVACGGGDDGTDDSDHDFGTNNPDLISAVGDSITHGFGATPYTSFLSGMVGKSTINNGIDGARSDEIASRTGNILLSQKPGYLVIMAGTNDIGDGRTPESVIANLSNMIDTARNNQTIPILCTIPPAYGPAAGRDGAFQILNSQIRSLGSSKGVRVADVYPTISEAQMQEDGIHPTTEGQQNIATAVANRF